MQEEYITIAYYAISILAILAAIFWLNYLWMSGSLFYSNYAVGSVTLITKGLGGPKFLGQEKRGLMIGGCILAAMTFGSAVLGSAGAVLI